MPLHLVAVSFDASDPAVLGAFWAGVLGRELVEEDGAVLVPRLGDQVGLRFIEATTEPGPRNRLHLHVATATADEQRRAVDTALSLGGVHQGKKTPPLGRDNYMLDPGGNEFCVIEPGNTYLAGCGLLAEVTCDGSRETSLFWRDALEWEIVWDQDDQLAIQSPQGGTKIAWDTWPDAPTTGRNRQRFHLAAEQPEAEVERLVALGAVSLGSRGSALVLADPGGDEFLLMRAERALA